MPPGFTIEKESPEGLILTRSMEMEFPPEVVEQLMRENPFEEGKRYRHRLTLDTDLEVLRVREVSPERIHLQARVVHRRVAEITYPVENYSVLREDLPFWSEVK